MSTTVILVELSYFFIMLIPKLIPKYNSGKLAEDFVQSIFTPIPKAQKADQCSDFLTIILITYF